MKKKFLYKVYSSTGTYLGTLSPNRVASLPQFTEKINGGQGQMQITYFQDFDDFDETLIAHMHFIRVYEIDEENPLGRIMYTGFISQIMPFVKGAKEGVKIMLLGLVSLLSFGYFKNGSSYSKSYSSTDPSTIASDVITHFNTIYSGSWIDADEVESVGTVITYQFTDKKWVDALNDTYRYSEGGWWWMVRRDGHLNLKAKPATPTHTFTIGKDVEEFEISNTSESVVNSLQYRYNGGGSTRDYSDVTSILAYGKREAIYSNDGTSTVATIDQYGNKYIDDNADPKVGVRLVVNASYDIESIQCGDTCRVLNLKNGAAVFEDNMQIVSVNYAPDKVTLALEKDSSFGKELEFLARKISKEND